MRWKLYILEIFASWKNKNPSKNTLQPWPVWEMRCSYPSEPASTPWPTRGYCVWTCSFRTQMSSSTAQIMVRHPNVQSKRPVLWCLRASPEWSWGWKHVPAHTWHSGIRLSFTTTRAFSYKVCLRDRVARMRCRYWGNKPMHHSNMPNIVRGWTGDILGHLWRVRGAQLYSRCGLDPAIQVISDLENSSPTRKETNLKMWSSVNLRLFCGVLSMTVFRYSWALGTTFWHLWMVYYA